MRISCPVHRNHQRCCESTTQDLVVYERWFPPAVPHIGGVESKKVRNIPASPARNVSSPTLLGRSHSGKSPCELWPDHLDRFHLLLQFANLCRLVVLYFDEPPKLTEPAPLPKIVSTKLCPPTCKLASNLRDKYEQNSVRVFLPRSIICNLMCFPRVNNTQ